MTAVIVSWASALLSVVALIATALTHRWHRREIETHKTVQGMNLRALAAHADLLAARGEAWPGRQALRRMFPGLFAAREAEPRKAAPDAPQDQL